jgi:hypothetical protein
MAKSPDTAVEKEKTRISKKMSGRKIESSGELISIFLPAIFLLFFLKPTVN